MANEENLIPAQKGEVRNPNGRGKGVLNRATVLKKFLDLPIAQIEALKKHAEGLPEGSTVYDAIGIALLREASKGDIAAIKEVNDTLHGKIVEKVQNEHSFTQMGRVKAEPLAITEEKSEPIELSFDVGEEVKTPSEET